ncbi:SCO1664 family protein [Streptomyces sp. 8L]|uniref:SCO1664 family protein n=1 Tax=Streptomyces sp. 8L TaxID=2877242 RepID=UPI001CD4BDC0|nr:SCO1664 family protein [Streptomyces sp. 8L]MCA1217585.1 SCO1664 family protein [Streptomyces sp. 8L]
MSGAVGETEAQVSVTDLLREGELTVRGRIREASNGVLYCTIAFRGAEAACVYKPVAGERPLWDFPDGTLAQREVAAYEVSEATGWGLVPPTVLREGPYGTGMIQLWIDAEPLDDGGDDLDDGGDDDADEGSGEDAGGADAHEGDVPEGDAQGRDAQESDSPEGDPGADGLVTRLTPLLALVAGEETVDGWKAIGLAEVGEGETALLVHADDERLRRLAVLDAVINNGDRKGGHLLTSPEGRLYAIDHGVTFNADDKLRTLLWGWAGQPLPEEALTVLARLAEELAEGAPLATRLAELITPAETEALRARVRELRHTGRHPEPSGQWPAIPWPPV